MADGSGGMVLSIMCWETGAALVAEDSDCLIPKLSWWEGGLLLIDFLQVWMLSSAKSVERAKQGDMGQSHVHFVK